MSIEKGDIEIEHVIFKINGLDAEFDALPYLFLNACQRPFPIGHRRFPAEGALKGTASRCEKKGIRSFADTIVSAVDEFSVGDEINIVLYGYIGDVQPGTVFE